MGVDPVLRLEIWDILKNCVAQGSTIMITTHYMEEASKADKIGFVRNGKILQEGSPSTLKEKFNQPRLDEVFFQLCLQQDSDQEFNGDNNCVNSSNSTPISGSFADEKAPLLQHYQQDCVRTTGRWDSFCSLLYKNLMVLRRHRAFMAFQTILPVVTLIMFLGCVGQPIRNLGLAVINEESECQNKSNVTCPSLYSSSISMGEDLSCHILDQLDPFVFGDVAVYPSYDKGEQSVILNENNGLIYIEDGFSAALSKRLEATITGSHFSQENIDLSQIKVRIDATNMEVARTLKMSLLNSIHKFFVHYSHTCNITEVGRTLSRIGIRFNSMQEASGVEVSSNLSHAMLPAMMPLLLSLLAMALTADLLVTEKEAGVLTRDYVCGVSLVLVLLAQMVCMLIIVICQIIFSMILLVILFPSLPFHLILFLSFLFLLQAICGMTLGFLLTSVVPSRDKVIQMGVAYVFPAFILSGILWPRISMPYVLQVCSVIMPSTLTCDVSRDIVLNMSADATFVVLAIVLPVIWSLLFFTVCLFIIRLWGYRL